MAPERLESLNSKQDPSQQWGRGQEQSAGVDLRKGGQEAWPTDQVSGFREQESSEKEALSRELWSHLHG